MKLLVISTLYSRGYCGTKVVEVETELSLIDYVCEYMAKEYDDPDLTKQDMLDETEKGSFNDADGKPSIMVAGDEHSWYFVTK